MFLAGSVRLLTFLGKLKRSTKLWQRFHEAEARSKALMKAHGATPRL